MQISPLAKLVYDAIRFAYLGAGEGLGLTDEETGETLWPEDFLMAFTDATDDEEWETFAQRIAAEVERLQAFELGVEYSNTDRSF